MFDALGKSRPRYDGACKAEELPGVKKQSFVLPFGGGEIWFEHLDGIYQFTELALAKLQADSRTFLLPSKPSQIGFVLSETQVTPTLAASIAALLCDPAKKRFTRVCFIGADGAARRILRRALGNSCGFAVRFADDFEKGKQWLIAEGL
ncbi:MAG: hypothetical protein ACI4RV_02865 [Eubacteriales bacterium]